MKLDCSNDDWQLFLDFFSLPHYKLEKKLLYSSKLRHLEKFISFYERVIMVSKQLAVSDLMYYSGSSSF